MTVTAAATDNYKAATATFGVAVNAAGALRLSVDAVAGDNTVNSAEKTAGFSIEGNTGAEADVTVTVTLGTQTFKCGHLGDRRGRDRRHLVGAGAGRFDLRDRYDAGPHGGRGQDRLHGPGGRQPHRGGGPDGPDRAGVHGAERAHGG